MDRVDLLIEKMVHEIEDGSEESTVRALEYLNIVLDEGSKNEIAEALAAFVYSKYAFVWTKNREAVELDEEFDFSEYSEGDRRYFTLLIEAVKAFGEYRGEKRAVDLFQHLIGLDEEPDIPYYFLAAFYSYPAFRDEEKMLEYIEMLDEYKIIDLFAHGEENITGLPDIQIVPNNENPNHMFLILIQTQKKLKEQRERNEQMIRRYSHNWSNLLVPQMIKRVVQTLGNSDYRNEALVLRRAYQNEKLLRQQSVMLQLRHSDDFNKVQNHVREGILKGTNKEQAVNAWKVLNEALEIVLFKIFFSDEAIRGEREASILRDFADRGVDISRVTALLEEALLAENRDMISWVNEYLLPFEAKVASSWNQLTLHEEKGGAYPLLVEFLTELFKNAFTYGRKQDGKITILLSEEQIEEKEFLTISVSNPVQVATKSLGTKEGISSMEELLKILNSHFDGEHAMSTYSEVGQDGDVYSIKLYVKKNLLIGKEKRKW